MRPLPLSLGLAMLAMSSGHVLAQTQYPLTLDNCGFTVTLPAAPQRVGDDQVDRHRNAVGPGAG
jgi:hypothetical protein